MKILRHLLPSLAAVIVLMTGSQELLAQQTAPLFTERFSNVFDPNSRTYFSLQGTEGKQFGGQQPFASIGATHYTGSIDDAVTLYSGQFMMNYNAITGNPAGSLGVQQRWLTDLPVLDRSILGAGLYVDFTQSRYNNLFQQINVNLELFTESAWVARANAYLPVGQIQQNTGLQTIQGGAAGQLSVVGTTVGLGGVNQQWMDVALMGSDLELGHKFFNYRTEVYGGYYNWNGPLAGFTNGVKGGVRSYLTNNLSGNVNVSHDQFFGTNVYGGLTYFFGGSGGSRPNSFENLMTLPAQRSQQVSIGNYIRDVSTFKPLHDSITGDELHMYFVKENGQGSGTQANPSNIASVIADTHFATGSAMILMDANGNLTTPFGFSHDRQQAIGGGSTGTADVDFSLALGQAPGTSVVHLSNLGGRPVLAPTGSNAITLSNQNTIQGFTIDGSGGIATGILGFPQTADNVIRDMRIQNIAGTGIFMTPSIHTTIDNVTFLNNNKDVMLSDSSGQSVNITNITSTGATQGSLQLGDPPFGLTGTINISNVNITGAGGFGGIQLERAQNGATINMTDVSISGGTGSGVTVVNSQTGSIYNLINVDVLNVGGNGMALVSSNGSFNVNGTSSITNAGTAAFAINGGAINVQYDGSISQGVAGSAVAVTGNHTGTVNFGSGSSINTTLGDGLQFNGADGSYTFLGTTNMNGGDAGIDIFNSNGSFVFTNPFINNTASGMGVKIVGGGGDSPITTFNGLNISSTSNQGFFVSNGGLTTVNGTATINTQFGTAFESQGTALAAVFTDITSTQSPAAGININNSSGTFGVTGTATVSGAALSGINIMSSNNLTSTIQNVAISNVGTGALDNGVTLSTAGTVNILGGTINGTTGDGINSNNTNLTATGLNIGGTGTINGDGIEIVNVGTARTVNLSNNTIKANASGISTKDSGIAKELLLTLDGNTLQSLNPGSLAMSIVGNGTNSTIIQSMNGGTVIGGTGGGVNFNRVTFDASGTALSGTQLNAGTWTIGTSGARVQGDGLRFDAPTGDLKYGTLNIANNAGTGLYVDTKTLGTTFTLSNSNGTVDTTNGAALFLDPLTTNLTFGTVSSTNSTTTGATLDAVTGSVNINQLNVSGAAGSGLLIQNSSGLTSTIQNLKINTVGTTGSDNGVTLSNAGNVNILGGTIQGTSGDGIHTTDTNLTVNGLSITGGLIAGDALQVVNTTGSHTVSVANSALVGGTSAVTTSDSGAAGGLVLSLDNNTYMSTSVGGVAFNVVGSGANSTIIKSMNGGTVLSGGGATFNRVTFDASGTALSGTQVNAGDWTFGGNSRLVGNGLNLTSTSGNLQFGNLTINNNGGTGLIVDTKSLGTTFTLGSTGGVIDTTSGSAMSLDPLTANLNFQSVTSTNSTGNGITLDTVAGTVNLGAVNITNATNSGIAMDNSSAAVTAGQVNVNGAVDGLLFGTNNGGSFAATGTTTLSNVTGSGINMQGATGTYNFADLNITSLGSFTGLDFRNSNVTFTSGNTSITGDGTAGSIGIDLSGSQNPNGANSTTSNIHLATGAGQTAIINNVDTGILLGNVVDGSAGAYLVYGNQTALNSGSQINVTPTGLTLDTTNLTSTNGYTQGRYEFLGVSFTGIASFQKSNDLIFVGSTSSGTDDGSSPLNRISVAQLLALDATPSNLDGKTVVLVNDNGGVGINLGANTLTLGDNTILDSFGNGQTFSTNGVLPVNVIVDTISGNVVYSDPNGAATLTNNGSTDLITLGNSDTVQNLILSGGTNTIFGSGVAGANINNNIISGSSLAAISLINTTGTIGITQNAISNTGTEGILLTNAGTVSVNGGTINGTGGDGIHSSDTNLTVTNVNIGGTGTIAGDGIEIVNNGSAHTVNLSNNTIKANASGISTVDSGNAGELLLTLDGNTLQSLNAGSKALSVLGGGLNSTIVTSMNGGTVIGGANSGGVVFDQVTFDASGTALLGTQVTAGNWTIGTNAARVQGDGLRFDGPSGNLAFGALNVSNNAGTGLYVDTKSLGTTFTLGSTGGAVDTTGGSALFLDPLTTNMTLGSVTSTNSTGTGITLDAVGGTLTIGTLNVSNSAGDGAYVNNSTGTININGGSITGALGDSFHVNGGSANVTYNGSITSSAGRVAYINGTTGGGVTFGGVLNGDGPGQGIRLTNNAGNVTFNGDVSLGANTALSNEAVYMTSNTGNVTFGNLDVNVNTLSALGAIYGTNNALVTIGGGNVTSTGAAALNLDSSKIDITLSSITASGGTDGLDLTNLASGSILNSTTTTITNVEQTGVKLNGSQGSYNLGTLEINGAKTGIDFRNSNLSFTSANTTITGNGSPASIGIDLSGTQNPNGANSTTPNIQIANAAGQTAIINNVNTGVRMGNVTDGSAGAYLIYGNQTPLNSGSQVNVINGGITLDATHLTSTDPYTQGRYEFKGVSVSGNTSFPTGGAQLLFVGSVASGNGTGSDPNNRMSIGQLLALDATPSNLDNLTVVLVNDSGSGGGAANLDMAANTLTLGTNTILDSFGNGQSFTSSGPIVPVNIIIDTLGAITYNDPYGNGAAILTNNGSLNLVALGNGNTVQNVILSGGQDQISGSGVAGVNINHTTFNGLPGGSAIHLVNTTGTINLDTNTITNSGGSGILLSNAGTVSISGGTIDNTSQHGIESINTNLSVDGVTFGGTLGLAGAGVSIVNNDATNRTVNLTNLTSAATSNIGLQGILINSSGIGTLTANLSGNSLAATQSALQVNETAAVAVADTVRLNLTGTNTFQSGSSAYTVEINGQNVDANNSSVVITSLGIGNITGNGTGGGVQFNRVGFDSDLNTVGNQQVAAGAWNIGQGVLSTQRVQGDGLRFDGTTGDLSFSTLNVYNNNGTGLYADTKTLGTTFALGNSGGTIDTSNGAAVFLDPLTTNMTFGTINSTNSLTNGITLDTVAGTFTVNGGTIANASSADVAILNSSATVQMSGLTLNTNGNTGVSLNGNTGAVTFSGVTMNRTAGDTAFDIDATTASTGKITVNGASSLGTTAGTAFLIGAGARDIDATALAITNSLTSTAPVISITGQSGGTIGFGDITNSGTTATNVIATTGQTGGTVNFGNVSILGFGNASTDTAVSLAGTGGAVNFTDLDITTTNGGGLTVGGITFAAGSTPTINATGGTALTLNGTTLSGGAETFDSITASGGVNGINLNNVTGSTTFTTVNISGTTGAGILLSSAGTVAVNGGTIDGTADDGIHSADTDLTVNGVTIGGVTAVTGDGIEIVNNGTAHVVNLSNNTITADASGISTVDGGNAGELLLTLDNNTLQSLNSGSLAMSIQGGGADSTIIRSMNGGTIIGGANSGGILFNQVTFDASGTSLLGTQVTAGNWTIGTNAARVQGDGLRFDAPTGDVAFGTLNVSNNNGTGVYVDTKTLGTTFNLANTGGTVDTTNGAALFLDPLSTNMTFASITSDGSGGNGVWLDGVSGSFTVTGTTTVTNAALNGILINDSTGATTFGDVSIDTTGADGVHVTNNTGTVAFNGTSTIQNTTGDGIDLASAGGGVNFATTAITSAGANGINLGSATGSYTFGGTTINGFGTNKAGVSFVGANAAATFGVTDIQNGGNGTGIDLSSTTGNKVITFATGSNISNVNLGVELSSSHTTATTANANFTFGDGALPTGSTINAATTVNAIGLDSSSGTYNFVDVAFTGTASLPGAVGSALFVSATAINGVGDGSFSNPYSVSDADAVSTVGAKFVFLDGTYDFNSLNGGNAFTLAKDQSVAGLDNGNTVVYGTVQPANVSGNLGATGGIASRTSSLSITDSGANGIFDLAGGNSLLDITLTGSAATTYLVGANSATVGFDNTNGISLNGVTMSNPVGSATALQFTNLSGNVTVDGNNINLAGGRLLDINGGTAIYSITRGTQPDVGSTPGVLSGPGLRIRNTTGGSATINGMTLSGTGTLLTLDNNDATFSFLNNTFSGGVESTLFDIDTGTGGSTSALTFDATNSITQSRGTIAKIGAGARNIDLSLFNFNNINTTNANVISSVGQTGGTIKFGTIGISNFNNVAGTAVSLGGTGGTVQFGDLDITTANGNGLNVGAITFDGGASPTISTINGSALVMNGTTLFGGSKTYSSISSTGGANGISLTNVLGTTTVTGVTISGSTGDGIALSNAGTVILNGGTIDGTGGDGIHSANTDLTVSGMLIGNATATTGDGLQVVNSNSRTLVIDNTTVTSALGAGITVDGSAGGTTTVTSFNGNLVSNAGAGGVLFNGVTFDATPGGAIQQVTGGNLTIGTIATPTNVAGDGLVLNNVLGDIAFGTLNIANNNGTGLYIRDAAGKGGSFAFTNTGGQINTTNGSAMDIDPVTMNSTFTSVNSTNANGQGASTLGTGINLDTIAGTVTINGGSITGATGDSFRINGGTGSVTYSGNITHTAAGKAAVAIGGGHNTGTVTFNTGIVSATNGTGLQFDDADGTYNFNGTTTLNGGDAGIDIVNGSAGTFTFGTGTSITSPTAEAMTILSSTANVTYSGNITQGNNAALVSIQNHSGGTVTFQTGTLNSTAGSGLFFNNDSGTYNFNGTTTVSGPLASIQIASSSGTFGFGSNTSLTGSTSGGFVVQGGTAGVTYSGNITQANNAAAVSITGHSVGTVAFGTGTINATNGTGLQFDNADGTYNFTGTTTLNGGNAGIDIVNGSAGTFAFGTGTTITSPTGTAFNMDNSTAGVTFSGNITQANNASLVSISNESGGTVTFQTGTLSATNGNGIQLSNADNTVNFNGTTTLNGGNAGVDILSGSSGSFTFGTGTTITSPTGTAFNMDSSSAGVLFSGNITQANNASLISISNESGGTVTFQTGTLSATNGNGIQLSNADNTINFNGTTTLNGGDAGIDILSGSSGSFTFGTGTTITSPTGVAFNMDSSSAGVLFSGNITQANNASLVSISNESGGTVTFQTGTLSATNGDGIQLSNADNTINFNGTTTLNGGNAGVDIVNGSSGTITFGTGTSITNPSGLPYNEDTSTANVTFNGSITKTSSSNSAILINAKTGGTTTFNGLITATTGVTNAISLTSNTGGTINFANTSGTSNITTTSGNGFNFTGGGALNISGNNYAVSSTSGTTLNATAGTITATGGNNTIASTTGRAVNINGATIGGSGVTLKSVSANGGTTSAILLSGTGAGNFTVTGDGTGAAGAQGGNASGGTIQNITGTDAISLNNVGGLVSLNSMSILNITSATDASDAKQTLSGVDAIQGTGNIGGLSLVGVKISNTSDMAINGVTGTNWNGLTINNSLLEKSNRYGVSGKGDDNNEGMVQILGINGTVSVTNSKFDQGARLLDLQTSTTGNLNLTATNNIFSNSWKGFDSAADSIYFIGGDAVRVLTQGSATATVIIGDQNQSNAALGNTFLNDRYSMTIGHTNSTDTGLIKTTISENNFQVTNHKSPTGSPLFNYPNGTVLLIGRGVGGLNANVSHNTFDQLTDSQGLFGSLNVAAENGTTQVRINNNTFIKPWDHSMHLRTNNSATLTAEINNNTYVGGTAGGAGTDSATFNGPWDNIWIQSIGSSPSVVNVTIHDEAVATNTNSANDIEFTTAASGQTLNVFLYNLTAPKGYKFNAAAGSVISVFRNGSAAGTLPGILSDNNVFGGGGTAGTNPPTATTPGAGTVQGTNTQPPLPSFTIP